MDTEKTITAKDVGKAAGVSQSTVSRVFSKDNSLISEKTRELVLQVANELGYRPNAIARSLVSSKTKFIGIVRGHTYNPMFSDILTAIMQEIQKTDYQVIYYEAGPTQTIDDILDRIFQYQVQGIILLYANLSSKITGICSKMGIPVLQMMRYSTDAQVNMVIPDNIKGAALAIDHLWEQGYRSFAYVTGEMNSSSNLDRQMGFLTQLSTHGISQPLVVPGDYTYESGCRAMQQIVNHAKLPCGVLCSNDLMALGLIDAARALTLRVPEDIGVVGFDDNYISSWPVYELSSMRQPIDEMARKGVEILLRQIEEPGSGPQICRYDLEIVPRKSSNLKRAANKETVPR